ncbi:hypothetical protein [Chachezhania antarctica]|uniref:hypothetical protein n=1 Tax=Chachezhania antarctica TaxID=2340860 RepID=UPI001F098CDB|nr:hypothetical protein [Chachezhania antarctica]
MSAILSRHGQRAAIWRSWIRGLVTIAVVSVLAAAIPASAAPLEAFYGAYSGSADVIETDGTTIPRDMSVEIAGLERDRFLVSWTSVTFRTDGRVKEKSYTIEFKPADRPGVYAAAQTRNVFGHEVQFDPMSGEPFVWARIVDDTMTVFSLFVGDDGGYEMQQFDRTLEADGLHLSFSRVRNGEILKTVEADLVRD